jgi:hypothetical protein
MESREYEISKEIDKIDKILKSLIQPSMSEQTKAFSRALFRLYELGQKAKEKEIIEKLEKFYCDDYPKCKESLGSSPPCHDCSLIEEIYCSIKSDEKAIKKFQKKQPLKSYCVNCEKDTETLEGFYYLCAECKKDKRRKISD